MKSKRELKRELILAKAEEVFIDNGFANTTMQDIIDACQISRGGIYLYFSSVEEIFTEVIKEHHNKRQDSFSKNFEGMDFEQCLSIFFEEEKKELLGMKHSLKSAMYEFFLANKQKENKFLTMALFELRHPVIDILSIGVEQGIIPEKVIDDTSDMIMLWIEGMEAMAVSTDIDVNFLDKQFLIMKQMLLSLEKWEV